MIVPDARLHDVLTAVLAASVEGGSCTDAARSAAGRDGDTYLASLVREGWLVGRFEMDDSGLIRALFIEAVGQPGLDIVLQRLAGALDRSAMSYLRELSGRAGGRAPMVVGVHHVGPELEQLRSLGLVTGYGEPEPSPIGRLLLDREEAGSRTAATVIQGVTNSQIAVGDSRIIGTVTVGAQSIDVARVLDAVEELREQIQRLGLAEEVLGELHSDLETIRAQATSPRPKRGIIAACADNIRSVLQGVAGNAAFAGIVEILKQIAS